MKTVDKYQFNEECPFNQDGIPSYVAVHTVLKKKFLVKMVTFGGDRQRQNNNYLTRQCNILKKITHEHVYRCHKLLKSKNNFYAVFDFLQGKTLQHLLTFDLSFQNKAGILQQLLEFVFELRARNIVNANITPSNIVLQDNNRVVLKNFGLSHQFEGQEKQKDVNWGKTYHNPFFAPEIQQGKLYKNSDLYSLGLVISALFASDFKKTEANKITVPIVLQKFGVNVSLSMEKLKKIAGELASRDSKLRPDLKESIVNKKAYLLAPSPQKSQKCSSKSNQKSRLRLPESSKQLAISRSSSNLSASEDKNRQKIQKFQKLLEVILKKRGLTIMLLEISYTILSSSESEVETEVQLCFLLVKKATYTISQLKKLLTKGYSQDYLIIQRHLQTFQKEPSFKYLLEIINVQVLQTQQKFTELLGQTKKIADFSKNESLQQQTRTQQLNESYFSKVGLQFLLQLSLSSSDDYISQFKGNELFCIYVFSLISEFKTLETIYEYFFSQEVISFKAQPLYQQLALLPKTKIMEMIDANTSKLYSETSGSFDLSVKTTKTAKTMKTIKSFK